MVLAPEHPLVEDITTEEQQDLVRDYVEKAEKTSDIERLAEDREKTGVFTGAYAINPFTEEKIPIWIADYVLYTYGTGAIMAVPAHDERDYEFAQKYQLSIREVISPDGESHGTDQCYTDYGMLLNSGEYSGMASQEAIKRIAEDCEAQDIGRASVQYRLRDWLISRQRYWGAPIPIDCIVTNAEPSLYPKITYPSNCPVIWISEIPEEPELPRLAILTNSLTPVALSVVDLPGGKSIPWIPSSIHPGISYAMSTPTMRMVPGIRSG